MVENGPRSTFELLLEGPRDRRTLTVRRLRSVLMEELNLNMESAQSLIEQSPICIHTATDPGELRPILDRLSRSGGNAHIIKQLRQPSPTPVSKPSAAEAKQPPRPKAALLARATERQLTLQELQSSPPVPSKTEKRTKAPQPTIPSAGGNTSLHSRKRKTRWELYREQVSVIDAQFRRYVFQEFAVSQKLLLLLSLLSCTLLIQIGIYADNVQYRRYQRSVKLLENYIHIAVLGGEQGYLDPALAREMREQE